VVAARARGHPQLLHRGLAVDDDLAAVVDKLDFQHIAAAAALDVEHVLIVQTVQRCLDGIESGFRLRQEF
jgi:hypothetical protein